ncbi:uncharacterized protein [Diabrotica undecimpunctata]|uniref:uncharacterized protein isoform X1 n=2 Tax=Diabrotica undecimpunctata TaxID=50387 RepID=UPI003B6381D6
MFPGNCYICCKRNDVLYDLSKTNEDGLKLSFMLVFIVPEVEWLDHFKICNICITETTAAYRFKEKCINSRNNLKQEVDTFDDCSDLKIDVESDYSESELDLKQSFICYNCGHKSVTKDDLIQHIQETHQNDSKELPKYKRNTMCLQCGRKFTKESSIKEHRDVCDGVRRHRKVQNEYQCSTCKRFYSSEKILKTHQKRCDKQHLKRTDYQCQKCNIYYKSAKTLLNHKNRGCKKEGSEPAYYCKSCDCVFNTVLDLKNHMFKDHDVIDFQCEKCNKVFQNSDDYKEHKSEHKKSMPKRLFACEICSMEFKFLKEIIDHCQKIHELKEKSIRPYCCDLCQKRFRSSTNLQNHKLYHEGNRSHICSICGKSFITKSDLQSHEMTHYDDRNFGCDKCGKAFKTNNNLWTHYLIVHTDPVLWKFVCKICDKRFPLKSNHDQHFRRHTGQKEFICSLCKKEFASKSELQAHVRCHSNVKRYVCDKCGRDYRKKNTLDIHLTKAHGIGNAKIPVRERKYACHICPGRFYDKIKLARHLCTHSGIKPYACFACEKKFTDKSYMKHHLKTAHNIYEDTSMKDLAIA